MKINVVIILVVLVNGNREEQELTTVLLLTLRSLIRFWKNNELHQRSDPAAGTYSTVWRDPVQKLDFSGRKAALVHFYEILRYLGSG